ncbi:MAG TPA: prepilin-type N-terminal cleavage/methylation domain-containing protein [Desulfobacterales bacterium]|nr:prepilin-type N-terminal cleavage/methylation domain-containing protein [Desulfobacterales bacterium]
MAITRIIKSEKGFTLIELLVALAILGGILTGVVFMFTSTSRYHTGQEMMVEVTQNIRAAKNLMVDELRSAGCNPDTVGRIGFEINLHDERFDTDDDSLHFTRDIDNGDNDQFYEPDGDTNDPNEDISYYRVDAGGNLLPSNSTAIGTLVRNTGGGGQVVVDNVVGLQFRYFDASDPVQEILPGTMTKESVLSKIRTVEVTITGQVQNPNRVSLAASTWTQQFRIRIRNLSD